MLVNLLTDACITRVRDSLVFWTPGIAHLEGGVPRSR